MKGPTKQARIDDAIKKLEAVHALISAFPLEPLVPDRYEQYLSVAIAVLRDVRPIVK